MKILKRTIIVIILIGLVGLIGYRASTTYQARKKVMAQAAPEKIVPVETVRPSKVDIADKIHASANIQADSEITIYSKVSGKISKNLVKMGSVVQAGQAVAVVNRDEIGYDFMPFEVKSDAKGVVSRLLQNPGATVNSSVPLMTMVDIDSVKAVAAVDEKKIRFIKMDMAARVKVEAYPGETFAARVTNISPVCNPLNRTVDVELSIPNSSHRIKPGMYAEVEWTESRRSALVVPIVSVVERSGQKYVFLAGEGQALITPISAGAVAGDVVEILSGLKGDERVITTGAGELNDKDKIKVVEPRASAQ